MKIKVDFGYPILSDEVIQKLTKEDIYQSCKGISEVDETNIYFMLKATLCECERMGKRAECEKLCYLISDYLFFELTPAGSAYIALYYAEKAAAFSDNPEKYKNWIELVEKGN